MNIQENKLKQPIQVLYIEDSDADADLVSECLNSFFDPSFTLHRVIRLKDAFDYLETHPIDVVLLDLNLPDSQGFDTVNSVLAQAPELPVIILTGSNDKSFGVQAIKDGVQDYLAKDHIEGELLTRMIFYAIERKKNILAIARALEKERLAHEVAEKAIQLRDEFISIASHEFRSPLSTLKMQIQLLIEMLQNSKDDYFLKAAKVAERQLARFCHLVEKLFDYSQIQTGRLKLEYCNCDLIEIVKDSIGILAPELKKSGCELVLNAGSAPSSTYSEPIMGEWDRLRLSQVFINLLSNGLKYASGKPLEILVSHDSNHVCIQFKDHGPGILEENKEEIFQRFNHLKQIDVKPGLGLGLYVVRQIINAHGGTIEVKSVPGDGAVFVINLPMKPTRTENKSVLGEK